MTEKRRKGELPSIGPVDLVEVQVSESTERWTDIHLEDGSSIRIKAVILSAWRVEGHHDREGLPIYQLKMNQVMVVSDAPEHLCKGKDDGPKTTH